CRGRSPRCRSARAPRRTAAHPGKPIAVSSFLPFFCQGLGDGSLYKMQHPMLSKADLFARLAEGHAAGITIVTPNKRLSQALMAEFDSFQIDKQLTAWEAPDILPFGAFVERLWEDALYSDLGEKLPLLLTPAQEQHLWEQVLED